MYRGIRILTEASDQKNYNDILKDVIDDTNNFRSDSGTIRCDTKKDADLAIKILLDFYSYVKLKDTKESSSNYNRFYEVCYANNEDDLNDIIGEGVTNMSDNRYSSAVSYLVEELDDINKLFDDLKFEKDLNPSGTILGKGTGLAESAEDISCPNCGENLTCVESSDDSKLFLCEACNEHFKLKDGKLINSKEVDESIAKKDIVESARKYTVRAVYNDGDTEDYEDTIFSKLSDAQDFIKNTLDEYDPDMSTLTKLKLIDYNTDKVLKVKTVNNKVVNESEKVCPIAEAVNDTLNSKLWDDNKELKPEVKETLLKVVDKYKESLKSDDIDLDIKDVVIVGSNANYNYTDKSDIDLHIIADLSLYKDKEDLAELLYNAYRRLFNDKYSPKIGGFEVELYVEPYEDNNADNVPDSVEDIDEDFIHECDLLLNSDLYNLNEDRAPLFIIKDKFGNQLSSPNEDENELWDRVESRDPDGRKGLHVVLYTGKDTRLSEGRKEDIENNLLPGEPTFDEYMQKEWDIDIFDDEGMAEPENQEYYLDEYERYLDHLYDIDSIK